MDENKEKELLGEESPEALTEQEKAEVSEILENLGNQEETAVTTDWDGLAQVGADDIIVEDNDESESVEEEEENEDLGEEELCEKCGKRARYTELDEGYPYCKACRETMKKTRMNTWSVLTFIAVIFSSLFAVVFAAAFVSISSPIMKGDMYMAEKKYNSAITCYEEAVSTMSQLNQSSGGVELFDAGNRTYAKIIKAYFLAGTPTYAQDYYSLLEESGAYDKLGYKEAKGYYEIYDKMIETYSNLQQVYSDSLNSLYSAEKKSDVSAVKDELKELEDLKANEKNDKYMVAYFQYLFCSVTENSTDEGIRYLEEIKAGGRAYEFIYAIELCNLYLEKGEYAKAEAICYESLEASPESVGVYQYLMMSKRRQGDYEAALKLGEEAAEVAETIYVQEGASAVPYSVPMEESIIFALMGEKEKSIAAIDASNQLGGDNSNLNLAILFHYLYHVKGTEPTESEDGEKIYDNVDKGYDQGLATISYYGAYYGLKVSDNIQAIMDGKKTLEDVFVNGEVDWQ